jgi:spore coat-associated protein N
VKKFLLSALAIILAMGMMGSAFAYFSDTETSTGNTFTAGTLDLKIRDGGQEWADGIDVAEWAMSNMAPGVSTDFGGIDLRNDGNLYADHAEIGCSYSVSEGDPFGDPDNVDTSASPDDFAKYVQITKFHYYNDSWSIKYENGSYTIIGITDKGDAWRINDADGVSGISLCDLKNDSLDDLPMPGVNEIGTTHFEMYVKFHQDAGNDLQGDTLNLTVSFTLNQDSSQ